MDLSPFFSLIYLQITSIYYIYAIDHSRYEKNPKMISAVSFEYSTGQG